MELRAGFAVSREELDDADRGRGTSSCAELDEAVRQIAVAENVAVFHGYAAAGILGISEQSVAPAHPHRGGHGAIPQGRWPGPPTCCGARGWAVPTAWRSTPTIYTGIVETAEHGGYLLLDHLRQILGGPLVWAPGVEGGVVLSLRGGDFVLDCGQDLSIGYLDHDAEVVRLYVEESLSFRVLEPDAAVVLRRGG